MRVLFVGDVVGRPGREAFTRLAPEIRAERKVDLVIVNGENAAGGAGLTAAIYEELRAAGADVVTNGNHVWDQKQFRAEIEALETAIRPLNLPPNNPGRGWIVVRGALVMNAIGRTFMAPADDPFRGVDAVLAELGDRAPKVRILDWHAEATSEKIAMGWHLDGRVSAVVGSHTHVPTADARILPNGTALVADAGMVGPRDSVLGMKPEIIVERFRTGMPQRFEVADGAVVFNSVVIDVDDVTGKARSIERLDREIA
ncbi:MAG TPA: TIGR00282 family metallophosphoesterase [Candidatus Limnocylindria bacterium]|nr:TIGR00282 family metallophosphoesterase [Candidatus Limnocylindria bacterium]